jgi:hypothetical protein
MIEVFHANRVMGSTLGEPLRCDDVFLRPAAREPIAPATIMSSQYVWSRPMVQVVILIILVAVFGIGALVSVATILRID